MPTKNNRTTSRIYPLAEAAKKANCKVYDLLHAGAMGILDLLVGVPDGSELRLLDDRRTGHVTGEAAPMRTPNLLKLRQSHCLSLELSGKTVLCDSPMGYSFSGKFELRELHPSDCDADLPIFGAANVTWKDPRRRWTAWSIFMDGSNSELEVLSERVLVASIAIDKLFAVNSTTPGNVQEWYKSDALTFMNQAAFIHWGKDVVKEDRRTHPKTEVVIAWFMKFAEMSPRQASKTSH